jgi:hypothetical protein
MFWLRMVLATALVGVSLFQAAQLGAVWNSQVHPLRNATVVVNSELDYVLRGMVRQTWSGDLQVMNADGVHTVTVYESLAVSL